MEATIATMTVVAVAMVADMVVEDDMMTAIAPLATKTVAMDVAMTMDPAGSTVMPQVATIVTAAAETIDVAGLTTIVVTADVAMVGMQLLREIPMLEVATIGTLVVE